MRKKGDAARAAIAARKLIEEILEKSRISGVIAGQARPPLARSINFPLSDAQRLVTEAYGLICQKRPGLEISLTGMQEAPQTITNCIEPLIAATHFDIDKNPCTGAARAVLRLAILAAELDYFLVRCRQKS